MASSNLVELTIAQPDQALFKQAETALAGAQAGKIATPDQLEQAGSDLKVIKGLQKQVEDKRTAITKPLNDALKAVNDLFRGPAVWLADAETALKGKMLGYRQEQERKAAEEQRRQEEIARKERERLAAQAAEAERKAREEAEAKRRAAEVAEAAGRAAEAAKLRAAAEAREAAAATKAEGIRERAASVVAPLVVADIPKVAGQSVRETWGFVITDAALLPREYTMPDEKKIGAVVRALKGQTNIPGVKVTSGQTLASRAN